MALHGGSQASMEAISRQYDTKIFDGIVKSFTVMKEAGDKLSDNHPEISVLEKHIKKMTGVSVDFEIATGFNSMAAHMYPPTIDKNHPIIVDAARMWQDNKDIKKKLKGVDTSISGYVNLDKARVDGVYSNIDVKIVIGSRLITSEHFTAEEVAAIFSHELGHAFTYFEMVGTTITTNHVMSGVLAEWNGDVDIPRRVEIMKVIKKHYDLVDFDEESAARMKNGEHVVMLTLTSTAKKSVSGVDSRYYDFRTYEAMSDQFVSRLGGAVHLATGLDKLMRMYGHPSYWPMWSHVALQALIAITSLSSLPFTIFFMLIFEHVELYDEPGKRFVRIRNDVVNEMKKPGLDKDVRQQLQTELDSINSIIKDVNDKPEYYDYVRKLVSPSYRKGVKRMELLQELEALSNNQLYAMANKLNSQV